MTEVDVRVEPCPKCDRMVNRSVNGLRCPHCQEIVFGTEVYE